MIVDGVETIPVEPLATGALVPLAEIAVSVAFVEFSSCVNARLSVFSCAVSCANVAFAVARDDEGELATALVDATVEPVTVR